VTFEELGQEFRKARLAKKWRPRDIVRKTRIQYEYVKKLEAGDFTFMPDPIIRGYIKAYSRDVGLNQDEMIQKFSQAKEKKSVEKLSTKKKQEENQIEEKSEPKPDVKETDKVEEIKEEKESKQTELIPKELEPEREEPKEVEEQKIESKKDDIEELKPITTEKVETPSKTKSEEKKTEEKDSVEPESESFYQKHRGEIILGVIIFVIIFAIVLIYLNFGTNLFSKEEKPVKKISVFEAQKQNLEKAEKEEAIKPPEPIPEKVKSRMSATETTWVLMHVDDVDTNDFMLFPGNSKFFEAENKVYIKIGNASNLFLWINDDSVGTLGTGVVEYEITANGIKNLREASRTVSKDTTSQ